MKFKICLLLILIFSYGKPLFSQDTVNQKEKINNQRTLQDTIPLIEFTHANHRRYTVFGSPALRVSKIKPIPTIILGTTMASAFVIQHQLQQNTIWKEIGPFNVQEDGQWSYYLDKAGHFYAGYMPSYAMSEFLLASGFSWDMSVILGSVFGLCYTGYIEVLDGYSKHFGFSPSDFAADFVGAGFFLAQHYVPFLQNFTPKFMYVKPSWLGELNRLPHDSFIDDYSSQTFWMSVNVHNLLPKTMKKYWPKWMEINFGYAVYSLCDPRLPCDPRSTKVSEFGYGNRRLLISLDYNLIHVIPDTWNFPNWLRQGINNFKLPSPTLEIGEITKFYLVYPFPIKLGKFRM